MVQDISHGNFLQIPPGMVMIRSILTPVLVIFVFGFFQVIYLFGDLSIQNGSYVPTYGPYTAHILPIYNQAHILAIYGPHIWAHKQARMRPINMAHTWANNNTWSGTMMPCCNDTMVRSDLNR